MPNTLEGVLANIPFVGGYEAARQQNQQRDLGTLQQAGLLQGILSAPLRNQLLQAQIQEHQQNIADRQMVGALSKDQLQNPDYLEKIGVLLKKPEFIAMAEKIRQNQANLQTLGMMKGTEVPVQREVVQGQSGPQTDAALLKVMGGRPPGSPPLSITVSPDASPDPTLAPTVRGGGLFDSLTQSQIPEIAAEARALKGQLEQAPANPAMVQYFQKRQQTLVDKEIALNNRPDRPVHLVPVRGADGKVTYQPAESSIGATPGTAATGSGGVDPASASLHGEPYISTLDPTMQNLVKKVISYDLSPKDLSSRTGERKDLLAHAIQADPNFSPMKYGIRYGLIQEFSKGQTSKNIVAIDQSLNHMETLSKLATALENNDIPAANAIGNEWAKQTGRPEPGNFRVAQQAVATELMRVFRQVNASEQETQQWMKEFPLNGSPVQIKGALQTGAKLLEGRIKALDNQWNRVMETKTGVPNILSPQAEQALNNLGVRTSSSTPTTAPAQGSLTPAEQAELDALRKRFGKQ